MLLILLGTYFSSFENTFLFKYFAWYFIAVNYSSFISPYYNHNKKWNIVFLVIWSYSVSGFSQTVNVFSPVVFIYSAIGFRHMTLSLPPLVA